MAAHHSRPDTDDQTGALTGRGRRRDSYTARGPGERRAFRPRGRERVAVDGALRTILGLARDGIQVFAAMRSLFLLRELEILSQTDEFGSVAQRYFVLTIGEGGVRIEQGNTADELQTLMLLDENLQQSDRYLALYD